MTRVYDPERAAAQADELVPCVATLTIRQGDPDGAVVEGDTEGAMVLRCSLEAHELGTAHRDLSVPGVEHTWVSFTENAVVTR